MSQQNHLSRLFLILFISVIPLFSSAWAGQKIRLADFHPDNTSLGIFRSYKHHIVLVSLVQADPATFKCLPNQYYLYDYRSEQFHEIYAGNLKINSDFSRIFLLRVHSLPGNQKASVLMLSRTLKIPADLISAARLKSSKPARICWQQPELLNIRNEHIRSFPFIAANLCKSRWCSELYWTGPSSIRFWIHSNPETYGLISLDVEKSTYTIKTESARFTRQDIPQLNAPRDNLVTPKTLSGRKIVLKKTGKNSVTLEWHKERSGRIVVSLIRDGINAPAAEQERKRLGKYAAEKEFDKALQSAEFALWLNPKNHQIKLDRLAVFASMSLLNRFFRSLKSDFSTVERFSACQKLHLDSSIRHLWKNHAFVQQFKSLCNQ